MLRIKNFKNRRVVVMLFVFALLICMNSPVVCAQNYISQTITINSENTPMKIGGGDMFVTADWAAKGEKFTVQSHYVDSSDKVWFEVERDGKMLWISKNYCTIANSLKEILVRKFSRDNPPTIYLSPSRQPHNEYAVGNTNEMEQMEALSEVVAEILRDEYGFKVFTAPSYMRIIKSGRPSDALNKNCDVYLAIHSNAASDGKNCSGAEAYYYSECAQSRLLAENIVQELNIVSDYPSVNSAGIVNAMECFDKFGYGEVRDPSDLGMIAVLAEVDYHDNPYTANMIIQERQRTAEALAKAVAETFYNS